MTQLYFNLKLSQWLLGGECVIDRKGKREGRVTVRRWLQWYRQEREDGSWTMVEDMEVVGWLISSSVLKPT